MDAPTVTGNLRRLAARGLTVALLANPLAGPLCQAWVLWRPRRRLHRRPGAIPPLPVAIVPGTHVNRAGEPAAALAHRLEAALDLYRRGTVQRVLVSGVDLPGEMEVEAMQRWLLGRGLPDKALLRDRGGHRTRATMQRAHRIFGIDRAVVCTQSFHLARAVLLGLRAGIDTLGLAVDHEGFRPGRYTRLREIVAREMAFVESYVIPTP